MTLQNSKIKDNSDFFLPPMPKWITHYSFAILIAMAFILLILVCRVKYPEKKPVTVLITKTGASALLDFETFNYLSVSQPIEIDMPVKGKVHSYISKNAAVIARDHIISPLSLSSKDLPENIRDSVYCKGDILLSNRTLMETLLKK